MRIELQTLIVMAYFSCYYDFSQTKLRAKYWEKLQILKIALYLQYKSARKIIAIRELLLTVGLTFSYFDLLALSVCLNFVSCFLFIGLLLSPK